MLLKTKQKRNKKRLVEIKRLLALYIEDLMDVNHYRQTLEEKKYIKKIDEEIQIIKENQYE